MQDGHISVSTVHAIPFQDRNTVVVKKYGNTIEVTFFPTRTAKGVNLRDIKRFNDEIAGIFPEDDNVETRKTESKRASINRTKRTIRELVACNSWRYFITITLSPAKWNRFTAEGLQAVIKDMVRRWRQKKVNGSTPYAGFKYLFVPEQHESGAIHLHGVVNDIPADLLCPYTLAEVQSDTPLPEYICNAVRDEKYVAHCTEWDEVFGWNTIIPIFDRDRLANYIVKYITKSIDTSPFITRNWSSHGLNRATQIAAFQIPAGENYVAEYFSRMNDIAVITDRGNVLNTMVFRPKSGPFNDETLAFIRTTIDGADMSAAEVVAYLAQYYPPYNFEEEQ